MLSSRIIRSLVAAVKRFHAADRVWTDRVVGHTPFHAGYWVRRRRDEAINHRAHLARGVLFDLGCGEKPYAKQLRPLVTHYWGLEYSPESGYRGNQADVCGDAAALPVRSDSVDTVLATELLEHVPDPSAVVAEIARILRPGGVVICTAPYFYPTHDAFDFFRFGPAAAATLMRRHGLEVTEVAPLSGTGLTIGILFNLFWFDIGFIWTPWLYPFSVVLRPALWVLLAVSNLMAWLAERAIPSSHMSFNHVTVARKPGLRPDRV